jgi:hypothetical protein
MMFPVLAGKVVGSAVGVLSVAAGVARHVAWYLSHRIDPQARERT